MPRLQISASMSELFNVLDVNGLWGSYQDMLYLACVCSVSGTISISEDCNAQSLHQQPA